MAPKQKPTDVGRSTRRSEVALAAEMAWDEARAALGGSVVPALALAAAAAFWLLDLGGVVGEPVAVLGVGVSLYFLVVFGSLRRHLLAPRSQRRLAALGFALAWSALVVGRFWADNFPGNPLAKAVLRPSDALLVPPAGSYSVVVDGRFRNAATSGRHVADWRMELERAEGGSEPVAGRFEESSSRQRLGRRGSTTVQVVRTSARLEVPGTRAGGRLRVVDLDPALEPELTVEVFPAAAPWVFPLLGTLGLVAVLAGEKRFDGDGSVLTAVGATYLAVHYYDGTPHPQLRWLIGAVLLGGVVAAVAAALVWRLVPRRWFGGATAAPPG